MTKINSNIWTKDLDKSKKVSLSAGFDDGIRAFCEVKINGKTIKRVKSDSFVFYFAATLYGLITGQSYIDRGNNTYHHRLVVRNVYEDGDDVIVVMDTDGISSNSIIDHMINLFVSIPSVPHLSGFYVSRQSGIEMQESAGNGRTLTMRVKNKSMNGIAFSGPEGVGYCANSLSYGTTFFHAGVNPFYSPQIIIGTDGSPVKIDDIFMDSADTTLSYGSTTIVPLNTTQEWTRLRISRPFTNNTEDVFEISEVGLIAGYTYGGGSSITLKPLVIRDIFGSGSEISVPPEATVEFIYDIETYMDNFNQDTDSDGTNKGLISAFMTRLHSLASSTNTSTNQSFTGVYNAYADIGGNRLPHMRFPDGAANPDPITDKGVRRGIVLGTNNHYVSQTDNELWEQIENGYNDGQLWHLGGYVNNLEMDYVNQEIRFKIGRHFVNYGSTDITVKEVGLYLNALTPSVIPVLNFRAALHPTDQFVIESGKAKVVELTLRFPV